MKLLTKVLEKKLPNLYSTEKVKAEDKIAIVKFFTPFSNWSWYAVEYDPVTKVFFGLVFGVEKEWGYFGLDELEECNKGVIPKIERDLYFEPTKVSDIIKSIGGM